jgi:hypothetical protein
MKKLIAWGLILVMVAPLLLAAQPLGKMVRLQIRNNSGYTVYMQLTGENAKQYYYLTIPDGGTSTYAVLNDIYSRVTWACDGTSNKGHLIAVGGVINLTFTTCFKKLSSFGEPGSEKVTYFTYYDFNKKGNCGYWTVTKKTYKTPVGCRFRYQY